MIPEGGWLDTSMHVVAAVLFLAGSFLAMVAGIGIARFPDLLSRMHAATKPQVLGLGMLMTALALEIRTGVVVWTPAPRGAVPGHHGAGLGAHGRPGRLPHRSSAPRPVGGGRTHRGSGSRREERC